MLLITTISIMQLEYKLECLKNKIKIRINQSKLKVEIYFPNLWTKKIPLFFCNITEGFYFKNNTNNKHKTIMN